MQRTRSSRAGGDEEDPGSDDYDRKRKGGAGRKAVGLCCVVLACWVLCVVAAAWVGWTFFNGAKETKEIGEELSAKGYDVAEGLKLYELKFLKRTVDAGNEEDIQEAMDKIWFARAKTVAAIGDIVQVRKMSEYWKSRGVKVERLSDLDDLQDWMVATYNDKERA